jgi:TolA-binding protein
VLANAARLYASTRAVDRAIPLWTAIVADHASAPEAPEADLEWARALRRAGNTREAAARLEHLIITYPGSALVAQARRERESMINGSNGSR